MNVTYILCLYKKDRLREDFGVLQSGPKGVILKIGVGIRGLDGVEIRGLVKYISIYCRWVEIVVALRIHRAFLSPTTPHRWTAIGVGAVRERSARDPLSNAIVPIAPVSLKTDT